MKISLITATYNSAKTLQATFESVRAQNHKDLEYIVVDGLSKDETVRLIEQNQDIISIWVSEKDFGIYDAINKGIKMATGDVVGLLHSDDVFADNQSLSMVSKAFENAEVDCVYADLNYVDRENTQQVIRRWVSRNFDEKLFYRGWMPAHPTFYLRREHYLNLGLYNGDLRISADYELMLRMMVKHHLKSVYLPKVLVNMRVGGKSNITLRNRWIANQEDVKAWKINDLKPKIYTRWIKPISKIFQYFK